MDKHIIYEIPKEISCCENIMYRPTHWRNAIYGDPYNDGITYSMCVDLKINNEWYSYGLYLNDIYCRFNANSLFNFIVSSGEVKQYIPTTSEQILKEEREHMIVERFQFKGAAEEMNYLEKIKNVMNIAPVTLKIAYEEASHFRRLGKLVDYIKESVPIRDEDFDTLFRNALNSKIEQISDRFY
jgi:hypothetical protein